MNSNTLLEKIESKYLLNSLFEYVNKDNFKLKLFVHSKFFQNKLDINIFNYQDIYFNNTGFYLYNYLCDYENYDIRKYLKDKPHLNQNILNKYAIDYFKHYLNDLEGKKNIE